MTDGLLTGGTLPRTPGGTVGAAARPSGVTLLRSLPFRAVAVARSAPATALVCLAVLAGSVLGSVVGHGAGALRSHVGFGLPAWTHDELWRYPVGAVVLPSILLCLLVLPLLALVLGYFERRVGGARAVGVFVAGHVVAALGTTAVVAALDPGSPWASLLAAQNDLGPGAGLVAVLAAATWIMPGSLGRQIRWVGTAYLTVMFLRSGQQWDLEYLIGWVGGLTLGSLVGRTARTAHGDPALRAPRAPRIRTVRASLAGGLVVLAVSRLITTIQPGNGGPFGPGLPPGTTPSPRLVGAVVLVAVSLLVANALRRGLPVAWWAAAGVTTVSLVGAGLMQGPRYPIDLLLWGLLFAALIACRGFWPWRLPVGALARALPRLSIAVGGFVALSVLTWWLLRNQTTEGIHPRQLVHRALFDLHGTHTRAADALLTATSVVWALALAAVALPLLYATQASCRHSRRSGDRAAATLADLIRRHGGGTLGWQRTWPGFSAWTTASGDVGVGYRVVSGVAIVIGDPVGPWLRWRPATVEFQRFCLRNGWTPAWYTVSDRFLAAVGDQWRHTALGEDAVVDLSALAFTGKSWQDVRTARNRAERDGIRCERIELHGLDPELRTQIDRVSSGWVEGKPLPEMGFTLGTVAHAEDGWMRTYVARDADGTVHGVTTWMPVHSGGRIVGWTLDVMRRKADGFRPVMEFLIAECVLQFQAEGYDIASLSVAPLARPVGTAPTADDLLARMLDRLGETLEPAYGFRSLLQFKTKFHPRFQTVHLAYFSQLDLTEIAVAIGRAYLPDLSAGQALSIARALHPRRSTEIPALTSAGR